MDQAESLKKHAQKLDVKIRAFKRLFTAGYESKDAALIDAIKRDVDVVMQELRKRCRTDMAAFIEEDPSGRKSAYLAGKQDVFHFIQSTLDVSMSDLIKLNKED